MNLKCYNERTTIYGNNQKASMNFGNKSEAILDINYIIIKILYHYY